MLKLCPKCKRLSVEYDYYHHVEKCLNKECGWVNRGEQNQGEQTTFVPPSTKLGAILEERNHKKLAEQGSG
jgi:hypothetical protein